VIGSALQKAIYAALAGNSPAIAGGRVYDRVPAGATFPYITIGNDQVLDDGDSCGDGWEVFADVHLWSRPASGSKAEVKDLAAQVEGAINTMSLAVAGFNVLISSFESLRFERDPDGVTEHGILTMRYILQPA
jgi:hypothetical protein